MRRERRRRLFLVDYAHPKLGLRTIRIRAARVGAAKLAAIRRIRPTRGRILGIREP